MTLYHIALHHGEVRGNEKDILTSIKNYGVVNKYIYRKMSTL